MWQWLLRAKAVKTVRRACGWVDDLAWWGTVDADVFVAGVVPVECHVAKLRVLFHIVGNLVKTVVLANQAELRQLLTDRVTPVGLPVASVFKDLGVPHRGGWAQRLLTKARWTQALGCMKRVAYWPRASGNAANIWPPAPWLRARTERPMRPCLHVKCPGFAPGQSMPPRGEGPSHCRNSCSRWEGFKGVRARWLKSRCVLGPALPRCFSPAPKPLLSLTRCGQSLAHAVLDPWRRPGRCWPCLECRGTCSRGGRSKAPRTCSNSSTR
jgi:hypothetical protein